MIGVFLFLVIGKLSYFIVELSPLGLHNSLAEYAIAKLLCVT